MDVLRAVIVDLYDFARVALARRLRISPRRSPLALPASPVFVETVLLRGKEPSSRTVLAPHVDQPISSPLIAERAFVCTQTALLLQHPTMTYDGVIATLSYGTSVLIEHYSGRYAAVTVAGSSGWIMKDDVSHDEREVFPQFIEGCVYDHTHSTTTRLRLYIKDEFVGGLAAVSLSSGEYATYVLARYGRTIAWPGRRPRVAGSWHTHLKGVRGVHSGVVPKAGSVMEYLVDDAGQLAYVSSVEPNETIRVSYIAEDTAMYHEATLTKDEWRELRPVFISVL